MIGVTFLVGTLDRLAAIEAFGVCGHIVMKLGGAPHGHDKRRCLAEILALRELRTSTFTRDLALPHAHQILQFRTRVVRSKNNDRSGKYDVAEIGLGLPRSY